MSGTLLLPFSQLTGHGGKLEGQGKDASGGPETIMMRSLYTIWQDLPPHFIDVKTAWFKVPLPQHGAGWAAGPGHLCFPPDRPPQQPQALGNPDSGSWAPGVGGGELPSTHRQIPCPRLPAGVAIPNLTPTSPRRWWPLPWHKQSCLCFLLAVPSAQLAHSPS